jgi:hypothetical protein
MTFELNQIFEGEYPPEAAVWCNENDAYITELEQQDGVRRFQIVGIPEPTEEELAAMALEQAKAERANAVQNITVEVDGMIFDGDETAQTRMGRTISGALALGIDINTTTRKWVLHDDTVAYPTVAQLARALYLAGEAQTDVWTVPYES